MYREHSSGGEYPGFNDDDELCGPSFQYSMSMQKRQKVIHDDAFLSEISLFSV